MKIQFKKLVWTTNRLGWWVSKTPLFTFHILEIDDDEFIYQVKAICESCIYQDQTFPTEQSAKAGAQEWLEEQLTQFIETPETPAQ